MGNKLGISMGSDAFEQPVPKKVSPYKYTYGAVLHPMFSNNRRIAVHNATGKAYCMHRVCKFDEDGLEAFNNEAEILRLFVGHPHVVQLVEVYEDSESIHLITELCEGNLIDRFLRLGHYSESMAAEAARDLLETVGYCHTVGVIIRDIKPENLLLSKTNRRIACIKIGNLGNAFIMPGSKAAATWSKQGRSLDSDYITPFYPAPEIFMQGHCGCESDVWSLGMVLYMALTGQLPFHGTPRGEVEDAICNKELDFDGPAWEGISNDAKDFIGRMAIKDPTKRATIQELLSHRWLKTGLLLRNGSDAAAVLEFQVPTPRMLGAASAPLRAHDSEQFEGNQSST